MKPLDDVLRGADLEERVVGQGIAEENGNILGALSVQDGLHKYLELPDG